MAGHAAAQRHQGDTARRARYVSGRVLIYGALIFWAFISLFPIYWTITTSFKVAVDVTQGQRGGVAGEAEGAFAQHRQRLPRSA